MDNLKESLHQFKKSYLTLHQYKKLNPELYKNMTKDEKLDYSKKRKLAYNRIFCNIRNKYRFKTDENYRIYTYNNCIKNNNIQKEIKSLMNIIY